MRRWSSSGWREVAAPAAKLPPPLAKSRFRSRKNSGLTRSPVGYSSLVRARDVEVGHTYAVLVPFRLPAGRYPDRDRLGSSTWIASFLTGARFRLTVTCVDRSATPASVEGLRLIERAHTEVPLTPEQAGALGLPPERRYRAVGSVVDEEGRVIHLPDVEPMRVPARWLRHLDDPQLLERTDRDADRFPFM